MPQKRKISLKIDDVLVEVDAGTTIMEAAELLGIRIPRLCYHPDLSLAGSCRVCVVDVKGMGYYMAACSSQVWEGMEVQTNSPEIRQARRDIVELLIDNHNMDCQTCERDGQLRIAEPRLRDGRSGAAFRGKAKTLSAGNVERTRWCATAKNASSAADASASVRKSRASATSASTAAGSRPSSGPAHLANMDDSVCIQCGQCINVCPTAAFLEKRVVRARSGRRSPIPKCTSSCKRRRRSALPSAKVSACRPARRPRAR